MLEIVKDYVKIKFGDSNEQRPFYRNQVKKIPGKASGTMRCAKKSGPWRKRKACSARSEPGNPKRVVKRNGQIEGKSRGRGKEKTEKRENPESPDPGGHRSGRTDYLSDYRLYAVR